MILPYWVTANHASPSGYGVGTHKFRSRFLPDDEPISAYLLSVNTREDACRTGRDSWGHKCLKTKNKTTRTATTTTTKPNKQIHLKNTASVIYSFHFMEADTEIRKVNTEIKRLSKGHRQSATMAMLLVS